MKDNILIGIDVYIKDDLDGTVRKKVEGLLAEKWQTIREGFQYKSTDVHVGFTTIPPLRLRKRTHRTLQCICGPKLHPLLCANHSLSNSAHRLCLLCRKFKESQYLLSN